MLTSTQARLGKMPATICADTGYGRGENYELMDKLGIKYNYFQKEQHRPFKNNLFLQENLYYNHQENYFFCHRLHGFDNITSYFFGQIIK